MRVSFSLLFLTTVVVILMFRYKMGGWFFFGAICALWGFLLRTSMFAPMIQEFIRTVAK